MIHWTGKGYKPFLVIIATFLILSTFTPKSWREYIFIISLIVGSKYSWEKGKEWNKKRVKITYKNDIEQEISYKENHSFYWIKTQYWGYIFWGMAVIKLSKISIWQSVVFASISILYFGIKYFNINLPILILNLLYPEIEDSNRKNKDETDFERRRKRYEKRYSKTRKKKKYDM